MAKKTNSFERFWKELKRRKVVHVITVYAASAFVILELVNMVARPLKLPEWTEAFVIVLLCIGFVIAVFISWIYDITPSGVKKTKPVSELKHGVHSTHAVSSGWKIATYISGTIIIALIAFNILSDRKLTRSDISIAVLPFKSLSDDPNNQYLADGIMDAILLHLSKIQGLRVLPRTSVEQYRGTTKVAHDIGQELDVEYLLEGSFQKFGDNAKLIVQLIRARKESHIWADEYNSEWSKIFSIQSDVAQTIAKELYASINPEEKRLIEKVPTANLAAYDLYLKANSYKNDYQKTRNLSSYQNAVTFYEAALAIDSAFAKAYTGLASAYFDRYQWETYFKENYLDSIRVLAKIALSLDDQLDEAYYLKGRYYQENKQIDDALDNYDKALKINPSNYSAFYQKGIILFFVKQDYVKGLESAKKSLNLVYGNERPLALQNTGHVWVMVGFPEKAKFYYQEALKLVGDSASYYQSLALLEFCKNNLNNAVLFLEKAGRTDTTFIRCFEFFSFAGQDQKAYLAANKWIAHLGKTGQLPLAYSHRIGYAFYQVGKYEEATYYFNQQIKYGEENLKRGREMTGFNSVYYDLAAIYAFLGDKEKAYQYLDEFNKGNFYTSAILSYARYDVLFDKIRSEERFQKILLNMEAKYQAEHERVKKWLEEKGML